MSGPARNVDAGPILELGAGRSILPELLWARDRDAVLLDQSARMLAHSKLGPNRSGVVSDAAAIPLRANAVSLIVSSLGDPYNGLDTWRECARVLAPDGHLLYTTPADDWARWYRSVEGTTEGTALFLDADGVPIETPSLTLPPREQRSLFETSGLSWVGEVHLTSSDAPRVIQGAPKLAAAGADMRIASMYVLAAR